MALNLRIWGAAGARVGAVANEVRDSERITTLRQLLIIRITGDVGTKSHLSGNRVYQEPLCSRPN
jgi:hypothetical protein